MSAWSIMGVVMLAGGTGGFVNALQTDNGFALPYAEEVGKGRIYRPGWAVNAVVGAFAALISWGLYGPFAGAVVVGPRSVDGTPVTLTIAALVGAILVGMGGARWLSNEVDKRLLRAAAAEAAGGKADSQAAVEIATASPAGALEIARGLSR